MRTLPLLMLTLTLALSCAEQAPADTGQKDWKRPIDREPVDDWSERTGVPSPFPCRADMVWCEAVKTDRKNPDGTDCGAWVPSAAWKAATRYVEGALASYTFEATAKEVVLVLESQFIPARVVADGDRFAVVARVATPRGPDGTFCQTVLNEAEAYEVLRWARSCGLRSEVVQVDTEVTPHVTALIGGFQDPKMAVALTDVLTRAGVKSWIAPDADGLAHGVFASVQVATPPGEKAPSDGGPFPEPREGEPLWAYVARLSREERFLVWPDGPDGEPAHPLDVYRRVDSEGGRVATFVLAPPTAAPDLQADDSH